MDSRKNHEEELIDGSKVTKESMAESMTAKAQLSSNKTKAQDGQKASPKDMVTTKVGQVLGSEDTCKMKAQMLTIDPSEEGPLVHWTNPQRIGKEMDA